MARGSWPRRGSLPFEDERGEASSDAFLYALAKELDLAPIDLVDAGRVRAEPPISPLIDDAADRAAFHSQLLPPGFSVRSFTGGYAPGKLFVLAG